MIRPVVWARVQRSPITLFLTEWLKIKTNWYSDQVQTPLTCWIPILYVIPHYQVIMRYFQLIWEPYLYILQDCYLQQQIPALSPAITTCLCAYISIQTHHWFALSYKITLSLLIRIFSEGNPIVKDMYASIINTCCRPLIIIWWITLKGTFLMLTFKDGISFPYFWCPHFHVLNST